MEMFLFKLKNIVFDAQSLNSKNYSSLSVGVTGIIGVKK